MLLPTVSTTVANCFIHTTTANTVCSFCLPGYYVSNAGASCTAHDCSAMAQCDTCSSASSCLICQMGYALNAAKDACNKIVCAQASCTLCESTAANQCFRCSDTYYLNASRSCQLCSSNTISWATCQFNSNNIL